MAHKPVLMSIVLWPGMIQLVPSISKMHIVGEGPGETPSALKCFFYLIRSLLTDIKCLVKNEQADTHSFCPSLMSILEAFPISVILQ